MVTFDPYQVLAREVRSESKAWHQLIRHELDPGHSVATTTALRAIGEAYEAGRRAAEREQEK